MTSQVKASTREMRRRQTRERILGAAIAEFKRAGMAGAVAKLVTTAVRGLRSDDSPTPDEEVLKWTGFGRSCAMSPRGAAPA